MAATPNDPLHIAIIGGGITGVNLALGLQARNISYTLYERAPSFSEIGAGIGFSPNAERAMAALHSGVLESFKRVANPNGEDYFQWIDGHDTGNLIFKLYVGKNGFQGGRRSDILDGWTKLIPPANVRFGKEIDAIEQPSPKPRSSPASSSLEKLTLRFKDGTTAHADAVIGCDGIRSRVREIILSSPAKPLPPAANPSYTQKFCYRALVPMAAASAAIGAHASTTRFMYNGPGAHIITYPVADNSLLNILAVISDPSLTWPHPPGQHTAPGSKAEAAAAFAGWNPTVQGIVGLLPDAMDKWGIFDTADHPMPAYHRGRACVAGDAAHATGPHLGAGGGMGVEDALVLAWLMAEVQWKVECGRGEKAALLERALDVYNTVRYERTQAVVRATREACDLFHWRDPEIRGDGAKFGREITERFHRIWEYDVVGMAEEALARLTASVS
ncbi:salicylate hydroxylase [Staphylotrichum tortipilum]|uniref:Salicylate hydroxylase n=1 Tax=Staphylotrichum tortipilum TaxID=2831512 RepID=A0AAN6MG26_9PEZI|nr:salicylate hydroxylase [Staphylotrichum longicolle]